MMENSVAVVLAAGRGTRMKSKKAKVLHTLAGKPMLFYTLEKLDKAGVRKIVVVIGYQGGKVKKAVDEEVGFAHKIDYVVQPKQEGTGDALRCGIDGLLGSESVKNVIAVNGDDSAFYNPQTVRKVLDKHQKDKSVVTFVSLLKDDPAGFGRVIKNKEGEVVDIVEERDASPSQKKIKEVNAGFYVFDFNWLKQSISKLKKSASGEYYIVDLVKVAAGQGQKVSVFSLKDKKQWYGVNTRDQLSEADKRKREEMS